MPWEPSLSRQVHRTPHAVCEWQMDRLIRWDLALRDSPVGCPSELILANAPCVLEKKDFLWALH